ncbi:heat-inducible transcriptional repressor HrcA [Anaeropeptidivorans aminofermentans]|jgi:heat-inducible transcriptional repressor|uniref:heat-inducible transcriptional repressor HrcA n=1 Tax=Anaeropeptidivorans aminofermentans TaxID=2934315 RepID=UPI0020257555|nr:heat-inducible transcriptional repressor HrcA [Anaeropeptidivorans aminofermentans]MBE6013613.1 heat-inducible transcription repressor HrcA [Lachnospiraceae bacterium]
MMLNDRKIKILEAIINDYILSAEPIGSRTIAKKYDLGISSATIRNEMSDLEEMGYIVQPHASAGRVPSDKGYRLYVDRLMQYRELTKEEVEYLQGIIINNINHMEYLMRETAKAISVLTNYTTIVSEPEVTRTKIKHLQLIPMDESSVVVVLITDNKVIKNHIIRVAHAPQYDELNKLSLVLNNAFSGKTIEEISGTSCDDIISKIGGVNDSKTFELIINAIKQLVAQEDNIKVYTSGVNNILEFPEFSDIEKARNIFRTFEEKQILITLLGKDAADKIEVVIGSENNIEQLKDCSIIKANYKYGNKSLGAIGIVGPTRMDYSQAVSVLYGIVKNLNHLIYYITNDSP